MHPELAAEADGWDLSLGISVSNKKISWICKEGHTWKNFTNSQIFWETGCSECAEYGFNPVEPSLFYLKERTLEQQFVIMSHFARNGWTEIEKTKT